MMLAVCVAVVLGLLSVSGSQAAPLTCEDLLRPLELSGVNQTLGKWMSIAESFIHSNKHPWQDLSRSTWIEISVPVGTQNNTLDIAQFYGFSIPHQNASGIECFRINSNFTLHDNNTWTSVIPFPVSEVLLTTCPDCLLTLERWAEDGNTSLKLYSRRRELTAAELDFFKKQVDCLSLPPATFMDPQEDLCPDTTPLLEDHIKKAAEKILGAIIQKLSNIFSLWG
ncbi:uncharacterized protein LOC121542798 [Coregonus clupeaformis]|uniref:uncharacterized protein LOC121542798 n=1 Tax=Coregonus clupeaformis TaxID=59861 RepID=UPI001E1C3A50|nr:uncharacterized protein LOC121542798 [Coregonus clupeaformis]